jgi:purine-binding chemotaxis protein CheW
MTLPPDNSSNPRATILADRAWQLARQTAVSRPEDTLTLIEFLMAGETYALSLGQIRGIHPLTAITVIPGVPDFIRGIINLRGEIISVVDLKMFFGLANGEIVKSRQVIILSSHEMEFGIIADHILGIRDLPECHLHTSMATLSGARADYIKGVTADGTVVLDDVKLLTDKKMCITL